MCWGPLENTAGATPARMEWKPFGFGIREGRRVRLAARVVSGSGIRKVWRPPPTRTAHPCSVGDAGRPAGTVRSVPRMKQGRGAEEMSQTLAVLFPGEGRSHPASSAVGFRRSPISGVGSIPRHRSVREARPVPRDGTCRCAAGNDRFAMRSLSRPESIDPEPLRKPSEWRLLSSPSTAASRLSQSARRSQ